MSVSSETAPAFQLLERNWTTIGYDFNSTEEQKAQLLAAFDRLQWQEIPQEGSLTLPMMQGEALKAIIKELRLPKVTHVADSNDLAPYGLLAVRCHYANGMVQVYVVDEGTRLTVLCSELYPSVKKE